MFAKSPKFRRAQAVVLAVALDCERESRRDLVNENAKLRSQLVQMKSDLDQSQTAVAFLVKGRGDAPFFPSDN